MVRSILVILSMYVTATCTAQEYISTNKAKAKAYLQAYINKNNYQTSTTETDSTIMFKIADPRVQSLAMTLYFGPKGKCTREIRELSCDSCYHKLLDEVLNNKYYGWTKIGENEFVSKFWRKLILIKDDVNFSYIIEKSMLTRKAYTALVRAKNK